MKKSHIIWLIFAALITASIAYGATRPKTKQAVTQAREAVAVMQQLPGIIEAFKVHEAFMVDEFKAELNRYKKETSAIIGQLQKENAALAANVQQLTTKVGQLTDSLVIYKPPDHPPDDFEECLEQIEIYIIRDEIQTAKIGYLEAINTDQGIVIANQTIMLEKQSQHIDLIHQLHKDFTRTATRRIIITQIAIEAAKAIIMIAL
jgi:cell division protein FtsB